MRAWFAAPLAALVLLVVTSAPVLAQESLQITTPYPGVAVEPGDTATFDLSVSAPEGTAVGLAVTELPEGWTAVIRGGGKVVDSVMTGGESPPSVTLDVEVPADAQPGRHSVTVTARGGGATDTLPLELRVDEVVGGGVTLSAEFASLRGTSDTTFSYDLELANNSGQELTFTLEASGPEGWQVSAKPSAEATAATVTVAAGETANIDVEADPPDSVTAGTFPIVVQAHASGGNSAEAELQAEVTGTYDLTLTTPTGRLNAEVTAGSSTSTVLRVVNEGTAPLVDVELSADPPTDWEVDFEPEVIDEIPPGESADVTAHITPSGEAIAGDYVVSMTAEVPEVRDSVDVRTTVETSSLWGAVGILLIAGTIGGLGWVFHRYGRR